MGKVLVTGGAGFIGSHLIEKLLAAGKEVVCLDNFNDYYDPALKRQNLAISQQFANFTLVEGDILNLPLLKELFTKHQFTEVVHLAARAGVRPSLKQPLLYEQVNVQGTMHLLELAAQTKVKHFIFGSSSSVYGGNKKVPFSEDDPVNNPISPYAATKRAGELVCFTYHHLYGLPVTCLRFFTVYGPRQRPDMAICKFTTKILQSDEIPVFGDGSSRRDYTYIDDIIDGLLKALNKPQGYKIYNLGESETISLNELISLIEAATGKKAKIKRLPAQPGDMPITYAAISKAKAELGYQPRTPISKGVVMFATWYLESKLAPVKSF